ncbi:ATP synthase subunit d-like protein [Leptotrombidium deliense]|uniref:ATP synthase subunit d, mitochondrial n=1 Tax=Leptotrombidium deliense TaxID=299467 RepID=A0A443SN62_9ACAR|nr:ATP synthase subunit d-like protein [Leptotrombidium deliense]
MSAKRIAKSGIDWAKFAKLVPESDRAMFTAFKGKSDVYLRKVMSFPENAPAINWSEYRTKIVNKAVVDELEKAYKAVSVPYPEDKWTSSVDEQEKNNENSVAEYCEWSRSKVKEAEEMLQKFKLMIPYDRMTDEEFAQTFPDWSMTKEKNSLYPHYEFTPGMSKEEREEAKRKPDYP